ALDALALGGSPPRVSTKRRGVGARQSQGPDEHIATHKFVKLVDVWQIADGIPDSRASWFYSGLGPWLGIWRGRTAHAVPQNEDASPALWYTIPSRIKSPNWPNHVVAGCGRRVDQVVDLAPPAFKQPRYILQNEIFRAQFPHDPRELPEKSVPGILRSS